jgi:lambda repressor-like predicted transcriptional regulator
MANADVKQEAKRAGITLWRIADELGICDMTLSRRLRHELPDAEKQKIREIIARLAAEQEQEAV